MAVYPVSRGDEDSARIRAQRGSGPLQVAEVLGVYELRGGRLVDDEDLVTDRLAALGGVVLSQEQEAALAALEDREHVRRTVENNKEGMRFYEQAFREMGLEWIPSQGNFILVKVGRGKQVFQDMLARGVIVRAQDGYGLPEWIRISVGTPAENARCIEVLKEVL